MSDDLRGLVAAAAVAKRGASAKIAIIVVLVAVIGLMFLAPFAAGGQNQVNSSCEPAAALVPGAAAAGPAGRFTAEAVSLATTANQKAIEMNMPGQAVLIILMTGWQESTMRNLVGGDRDSTGWLQQRPSQGWGTAEQIADPAYAAEKFYSALRGVAGWTEMSLNDAAQAVQRSGFPNAYARWEVTSRDLAQVVGIDLARSGDAYGDGVVSGGGTGTAVACPDTPGTALTGTGRPLLGLWGWEQATVLDPTNGRGYLTPRTAALVEAIQASGLSYPSMYCWDEHSYNPRSDHSRGKACDISYSSGWPTPEQVASGNQMANWLIAGAAYSGVNYIIWQGQIWYARTGAWQTYDGAGGLYNVNTPSGGHFDHVHVSVY